MLPVPMRLDKVVGEQIKDICGAPLTTGKFVHEILAFTPTRGASNLATLDTMGLNRSEPQKQQDQVGTTRPDR